MKRLRLTLLLLMLMMMLTACAPSGNSMEALSVTAAPQEDEIPRADGDDAAATDTSALIWYRYGDEPMLAAERRTVSRLPNEPYETALLRLLPLLQGGAYSYERRKYDHRRDTHDSEHFLDCFLARLLRGETLLLGLFRRRALCRKALLLRFFSGGILFDLACRLFFGLLLLLIGLELLVKAQGIFGQHQCRVRYDFLIV